MCITKPCIKILRKESKRHLNQIKLQTIPKSTKHLWKPAHERNWIISSQTTMKSCADRKCKRNSRYRKEYQLKVPKTFKSNFSNCIGYEIIIKDFFNSHILQSSFEYSAFVPLLVCWKRKFNFDWKRIGWELEKGHFFEK